MDYIKASVTRIQQLKNQKKSKERREQETKRKRDAHRHFTNGRVIDKYLPGIEPAKLENFLHTLTSNTELYAMLKDEAAKFTQTD
jgi:hypothetical protein